MRPSATIVASVLFLANAIFIYYWLFDTNAELKEAQIEIRKEAFQSAKNKIEASTIPDSRLNPNLIKKFKKPDPIAPVKPTASVAEASPISNEFEEMYANFIDGDDGGARLWCRHADSKVISFPARCMYVGNCFRCENSELIKPDSEQTNPFCSDGQMAKKFDTECCPSGISDGQYRCPDMPTCLTAEPAPAEGCTCGGSNECRFAPTAEKADCVCSN